MLLVETDLSDAVSFAEVARKKICEKPSDCSAGSLEVSASFGVAAVDPSVHQNFAELLEQADQRLYDAKHAGRNRVAPATNKA